MRGRFPVLYDASSSGGRTLIYTRTCQRSPRPPDTISLRRGPLFPPLPAALCFVTITLRGRGETYRLVRAYEKRTHTERTFSSVDLRYFESILLYFSDEEIEELQAAINERCKVRTNLGHGDASETGYSP
jgi:hypothetical protein